MNCVFKFQKSFLSRLSVKIGGFFLSFCNRKLILNFAVFNPIKIKRL